jgi:hypothetical protein
MGGSLAESNLTVFNPLESDHINFAACGPFFDVAAAGRRGPRRIFGRLTIDDGTDDLVDLAVDGTVARKPSRRGLQTSRDSWAEGTSRGPDGGVLKSAARRTGSAQLAQRGVLGSQCQLEWGDTYLLNILRDEKERWRWVVGVWGR